ncbi:MAG TPA: hypothetical protein VFN75_02135 [Pseudonocardiaceae bacterium]|nr:hypothetical protein [Pseudonocardiaceae bacterium]
MRGAHPAVGILTAGVHLPGPRHPHERLLDRAHLEVHGASWWFLALLSMALVLC